MPPPGWPSKGSSPKALAPLVAVVGAGVVGVVLFINQAQQLTLVKRQLTLSQQQLHELDAHNQELSQQLDSLQSDRASLQGRLSSLQAQLTSNAAELEQSRVALEELKDRYAHLSEERGQLQVHVATLTSERDEARNRLKDLEQGKADLERSVGRLRERLALLDRDYRRLTEQVAQLQLNPPSALSVVSAPGPTGSPAADRPSPPMAIPEATVELPPIIVRKDQAGMSMPVRGRLVEVNDAHNFIVVDKGSTDGVRVGMILDILRGTTRVGRATVVRVRPQLSACEVIRHQTSGSLQSGDIAVQSGP